MLWIALSLLFARPVSSGDWAEFRGADGRGVYEGKSLPAEWGPDKNVTWKTPIAGLGWSSPIALNGKLYLTTAVPLAGSVDEKPLASGAGASSGETASIGKSEVEGKSSNLSLRAICVDAESGRVLWDSEIFVEDVQATPQPHKKNSHASPTPVSDGHLVWVHFGHMGTACLDLDGKIVWRSQELQYNPVHGNGASPILVDDLLVFCCDGKVDPCVVALKKSTGQVRWKTLRNSDADKPFSFATCQLIEHQGRRMIVSPASDYCMGYDPVDGRELWRVKYPVPGWSLICRPVYSHGLLFVCTGYTSPHLIAFEPTGTGDITEKIAWQVRRSVSNTPTPLVVGDELYMISDGGICTCFDARTGKVHWSERLAGGNYSASPIVHDGKIYITSESGIGQVLAAGTRYEELSRSDMEERTFATFVPVDGSLFVRTESQLYRFDRAK